MERLPGIGPAFGAALAARGVRTVLDLLEHLPSRYEDRTRPASADALVADGSRVLLKGRLHGVRVHRKGRRGRGVVRATLRDATGSVDVVWFNQIWIAGRLKAAQEVWIFGPVRSSPLTGRAQVVNPEVEAAEEGAAPAGRIVAVYPPLGPLGGRRLRRIEAAALAALEGLDEPLPGDLLRELRLPPRARALRELHAPALPAAGKALEARLEALNAATTAEHRRLAFDELLALTASATRFRERRRRQRAPRFPPRPAALALPFELTPAQRRVLDEIAADLDRPYPMARLLEGDVGSGKTVVAALAMAQVLAGGGQVALMVPTELLAEQHLATLRGLFAGTPWTPRLLTGSLPPAERRAVLAALAGGEAGLVVGTHALIQESVSFDRLGLVVVDEQHRFGVAQRRALAAKGRAPHLLVMTATPIPRSLALTVYGDLDLSVIDELPPGRKPVRTVIRRREQAARVFDYVGREVASGGRAYVVYPLIKDSPDLDAEALEGNLDRLQRMLPGVRLGVLHGRMDRVRREEVVRAFREGAIQVLAATTVIEVGVDVPEASMMVIESPERFGLSQLHQLRGRVGRGRRASWCVLLAREGLGERARRRLEIFRSTADGFRLAEADLKLRGPGERLGLRQWGADGLRFADIFRDRELLGRARSAAARLAEAGELDAVLEKLARIVGR